MALSKHVPVPIVCALLVLTGCAAGQDHDDDVAGDSPEVTCERFSNVIEEFSDLDPATIGLGDILSHVSDGFTEMQAVVDEAQDTHLGQSIDTMADTLHSSIASAGGDVDAIGAEFQQRLQEPEIQEAATYLQEVCGMEIPV